MECEVCLEPFDLKERRPKSLPCAHNTICLACLQQLQRQACPLCRRLFAVPVSRFPDNYALMRILESLQDNGGAAALPAGGAESDSWWCVQCGAAASAACLEQHAVRRRPRPPPHPDDTPAADAPPGSPPEPTPEPQTVLDAECLQDSGPERDRARKEAFLEAARTVTRLVGVHCGADAEWALQLLQRAAATVEELEVHGVLQPHLRALLAMPRLRRLDVGAEDGAVSQTGPNPSAAAPGQLEWLRVRGLPRSSLKTLLRANSLTLKALVLSVGLPGELRWPLGCSDLGPMLEQCGLVKLRHLTLERPAGPAGPAPCPQDPQDPQDPTDSCATQLRAVSLLLPLIRVNCANCHLQY